MHVRPLLESKPPDKNKMTQKFRKSGTIISLTREVSQLILVSASGIRVHFNCQ